MASSAPGLTTTSLVTHLCFVAVVDAVSTQSHCLVPAGGKESEVLHNTSCSRTPFLEYIPVDGSHGLCSHVSVLNYIHRSVLMESRIFMLEGL